MADKEIGTLTAAAALDGTELAVITQGGNSRRTTTQAIANLAASVGGALTLIQTLNPAAVASIDSELWAGGTYKRLLFVLELTCATDGGDIAVRFKLNGAYKTAANYRASGPLYSSSGANTGIASVAATSGLITGTGATWGIGNVNLEGINGEMSITNPFSTTRPKRVNFLGGYGAPSGQLVNASSSAIYEGVDFAATLEGVRFMTVAGGTISGTISVYGML